MTIKIRVTPWKSEANLFSGKNLFSVIPWKIEARKQTV